MLYKYFYITLLTIFYLSCSDNPTDSEKTGTIEGKVTDSLDGSSISSANITTDPVTNTVMTNSTGDYEITGVNPGSYSVSAAKTWYITNSVNILVTAGNSTTADISLSPAAPTASFTVDPSSGDTSTKFNFDASGCSDNEDPLSALQIRWDWENDGNWDTGYSTTKTATHQYSTVGTYTIKMEVKNTGGLTDYITNQVSVYSYETGTVTDIDGNTYVTVKIGDQWWIAENLKVTHYRNGNDIPNVTGNSDWENLTTGAYCNYDNNESNVETYGRLYNWYAVDDSRNIAPAGWHVPTDEEWKQLEMYLGMSQSDADNTTWRGTYEGGKLKEAGTEYWWSPNASATNESGFSALPGGYRFLNGSCGYMGEYAYFWSSTEGDNSHAWIRVLGYHRSQVSRSSNYKRFGFSVRCVRD